MESFEWQALSNMIITGSGREFPGHDVRLFDRPCVYVLLNVNEALYIGHSGNGLSRLFHARHVQARRAKLECTRMVCYSFPTKRLAYNAERLLIRKFKPTYNILGKPRTQLSHRRFSA